MNFFFMVIFLIPILFKGTGVFLIIFFIHGVFFKKCFSVRFKHFKMSH